MTDIKFEIILEMFFLKLNNTNILFDKKILIWRTYITNKALSTIKQVQIIDKKDFVIMTLDTNNKTFVILVAI